MGPLNAWMRCWLCGGAWGECARRSGRPEAHQADFCCEWSGGPEAGNGYEAHFPRIPRGVVAPMRDAGDMGYKADVPRRSGRLEAHRGAKSARTARWRECSLFDRFEKLPRNFRDTTGEISEKVPRPGLTEHFCNGRGWVGPLAHLT